jgi:hypothetical protein
MPDSARSSVRAPVKSSPIIPDHGRMPETKQPKVRDPIAPAHEESTSVDESSKPKASRRKRGGEKGGKSVMGGEVTVGTGERKFKVQYVPKKKSDGEAV